MGLRDRDGFTLIEAMVALAIVATMLVPALAVVRSALTASRVASMQTQVALYAQGVMEETMALDMGSLVIGSAPITFTGEYQTHVGQTTIASYDCDGDSAPDSDCKSVTVEIGGVKLQVLRIAY